jgi:hypothetical protein
MLTRNYDNLTVGFMTILPGTNFVPQEANWLGGMPGVVKSHSGALKAMTVYSPSSFSMFGNSSGVDSLSNMPNDNSTPLPFLLVGSNNAEESYDDHKLDILTGLTAIGYRYSNISYTAENCIYNTVKTFVNNTEEDITVNEVGLYYFYGADFEVLLYRKKLDQPVTLKARGGTASFKLVIDIPYANKA